MGSLRIGLAQVNVEFDDICTQFHGTLERRKCVFRGVAFGTAMTTAEDARTGSAQQRNIHDDLHH